MKSYCLRFAVALAVVGLGYQPPATSYQLSDGWVSLFDGKTLNGWTTIGGVNLVAGFRPELWALVAPDAAPDGVVGFEEPIRGVAAHELPATQHDVVVWLAGASYDVVFDT